jgi:nicotinate-nucleotide pyrophosphorylase (carboxylating)
LDEIGARSLRQPAAVQAPDRFEIEGQVLRALAEDYQGADLTTESVVRAEQICQAKVVSREPGILCGLAVAEAVFLALDPSVTVRPLLRDGDTMKPGSTILEIDGPARAILSGERTALNFLQRLSGISSLTGEFVAVASRYGVVILDTRKTTPGLRRLEKYATRVGGGENHRMGLYDAVLIKDNHVDLAGGLVAAVASALKIAPKVNIEVEVRDMGELEQALSLGIGRVLLDNFTPAGVKAAVELVGGRCPVEVSGGVDLENLEQYARARPNYISVGLLTHSPRALNIALKVSVGG